MARPRRFRVQFAAFTLIEVAISLGVMSLAFTSLLALVPAGLSAFRDSMESSARADILRQLSSELQRTPFGEVQTIGTPAKSDADMRFFSDEGVEVTAQSGDERKFFGVLYEVTGNTPVLGDGKSGDYPNTYLKTVRVEFYPRTHRAKTPRVPAAVAVLYIPDTGV